jgi:NAD-dependent dihydropyrimidine dehydrogenase PreA subunit
MLFNKKGERGNAIIYIAECTGCGNCVERCRHRAIELVYYKGGRYARMKNNSHCTGCGSCMGACENDAIKMNYELKTNRYETF